MTVFASGGKSRTFDYQAGDVGYAPHYVENTGEETLTLLALFRSDHYADISLSQWMVVLPSELVKATSTSTTKRSRSCRNPSRVVVGCTPGSLHPRYAEGSAPELRDQEGSEGLRNRLVARSGSVSSSASSAVTRRPTVAGSPRGN